jgi:hypothetical protein
MHHLDWKSTIIGPCFVIVSDLKCPIVSRIDHTVDTQPRRWRLGAQEARRRGRDFPPRLRRDRLSDPLCEPALDCRA